LDGLRPASGATCIKTSVQQGKEIFCKWTTLLIRQGKRDIPSHLFQVLLVSLFTPKLSEEQLAKFAE
jgi:hypothetical protein